MGRGDNREKRMELRLPLLAKLPTDGASSEVNYPTIFDADGQEIASVFTEYTDQHDTDAINFIVRACNAHDQLVAVLKAAKARLEFANKRIDCSDELAAIDTALAAAGAE